MKCVVTGRRHAVLGKKRGEVVYLGDAHAARLIRAGHVEPAPEPPPKPKPKRTRHRTVTPTVVPPDEGEQPEPDEHKTVPKKAD